MKQYSVTGMSCAACSARVEKAVGGVAGVTSCAVSLLTNSMGVEGTADEAAIIAAVEAAGYRAVPKDEKRAEAPGNTELSFDNEIAALKRRLYVSLLFLAVLLYFTMGPMLSLPQPAFIEGNYVALGLIELLLTTAVMAVNQKFFISGFGSLGKAAPNMDTLVALGASAAYIYSTANIFYLSDLQHKGQNCADYAAAEGFYFESAAMILTLITVGKILEARSKGKTTEALKGLLSLEPKRAVVYENGRETEIAAEDLQVGQIFAVRPGESVPADGIIVEGQSALNEASLTGESLPVDKGLGETVHAASLNQSGFLKCRAVRVGKDTALAQIIKLVSQASATKAPIAKTADKVAGIFVPAVIFISLITLIVWLQLGQSWSYALARAISVLVISCPCALGLATPVAVTVGSGVGAKNGILFKSAASLEQSGRATAVVLDKTGTLTEGSPKVTDVLPSEGVKEEELIKLACSLEYRSEHPLAKAIVEYAGQRRITAEAVSNFRILPGLGAECSWQGQTLRGGSSKFLKDRLADAEGLEKRLRELSEQGKTPVLFASDDKLLGIVALADPLKADSVQAVKRLRDMGLKVCMMTGDNPIAAGVIAAQAGIEEVRAGVMPADKEAAVRELQERDAVVMVGDGINDAPALTRADVGIAIGAGTDVAIESADVVVMRSCLSDVAEAVLLGRAVLRNIRQNLFWAFIYNIIGIPLAAGVFVKAFGLQLTPAFGALAMSLSSFCVVSNALRLNLFKKQPAALPNDELHQKKTLVWSVSEKPAAEESLVKRMTVRGMTCGHCEARVKKALEKLPEVDKAEVSFKEDRAVVYLSSDIEDSELRKAVEDADYEVSGIE
ncbi:heavy metal translocating P-type ATPase [bacterium]|nr:heavy metal translocating P-type ATPase [bacterium]